MSHFYTLVLVKGEDARTREDIHSAVEDLLEKYSENLECESHMERCHCIGNVASDHARQIANKMAGSIESCRTRYWAMPEKGRPSWKRMIAPHMKVYDAEMKKHPDRLKPDPKCDTCGGKGQYETTSNPRGYWDWWVIGGRWTGQLSGYNPERDPKNIEPCGYCGATGVRRDSCGVQNGFDKKKIEAPEFKKSHPRFGEVGYCNACQGTGKSVKFRYADHQGDVLPAARLLDMRPKKWVPRALVTPDGEWIQRGIIGWWGMSREDMKESDWNAVAKDALETCIKNHPGCAAVVVDCHI